jgi:hypothetical protein
MALRDQTFIMPHCPPILPAKVRADDSVTFLPAGAPLVFPRVLECVVLVMRSLFSHPQAATPGFSTQSIPAAVPDQSQLVLRYAATIKPDPFGVDRTSPTLGS